MEKDYGEILCTAIDEIVSTRLQGLQYDITKQCTIKDDSRAYEGRYVVSDGGAKFEAFSSDTSFKNGNSVLVTIPNGDFTMQKTIVGRIASVDTTPFKYVSPLDSMIKIQSGVLNNDDIQIPNNIGLLANRNGTSSIIECFTVPTNTFSGGVYKGYTRLGIQADFKSMLSGLDVVEGSYGLKILIYADKLTAPGEVDGEGVWELTFSSEDMVGNPYQFTTSFQQEKVFDISDISNIREIKVYFYQNGNFKDIEGKYIDYSFTNYLPTRLTQDIYEQNKNQIVYYYLRNNKYEKITQWENFFDNNTKFFQEEINLLQNNLYVNNFKFYFGYELERYTGETLEIFSVNSTNSYHYNKSNVPKEIGLRWIHQNDDGTIGLLEERNEEDNGEGALLSELIYIPINLTQSLFEETKNDIKYFQLQNKQHMRITEWPEEGFAANTLFFKGFNRYEVRWFRYNFGYHLIDDYAKVNWERIDKCYKFNEINSLAENDWNNDKEKYYYLNDLGNYIKIIEWPNEGFKSNTKFFEQISFVNPLTQFTFTPNINLQTEKIKVVGLIYKENGYELDKEIIEADNVYIEFSQVKDYWEALEVDGKHPYEAKFFRNDGTEERPEWVQKEENSTGDFPYIKLSYLEIVAMQNTIKSDDINSATNKPKYPTSADYLAAVDTFINLFPKKETFIIEPYYSKELTFINEEKVVDQLTYDAATALAIVCEDGSEGNYLIYDQNGHIKNEGQGQGYEREFKLTYQGKEIDIAFENLDDIDYVQWYIPSDYYDVTTSTMLSISNPREGTRTALDGVDYLTLKYEKEYVPVTDRYPDFNKDIFMSGNYYTQDTGDTSKYNLTKEWDSNVNYYEYRFNHFRQGYSIKNQWVESNSNNIVRATLSINGNLYEALEDMKFGKGGSNGTNATFLLEFLENANALEPIYGKQIKVKARLYEGSSEVTIKPEELMGNWLKWKFDDLTQEQNFIEIQPWENDDENIPIYESGKLTLYYEVTENDNVIKKPVEPAKFYNGYYTYQDFKQTDGNVYYYIPTGISDNPYTEKYFQDANEFRQYIGFDPSIKYLKFVGEESNLENYFKNNFHILQGEYTYNNVKLIAYLSVPLKIRNNAINYYFKLDTLSKETWEKNKNIYYYLNDNNYIKIEEWPEEGFETTVEFYYLDNLIVNHIEGTKEVSYNSQGQPSYYANPYKIFSRINKGYYELVNNIIWDINNQEEVADDNKSQSYIPHLKSLNNKKVFIPSIYFAEGATNKICVYCADNNNYYWSQPVLIYKHRYDFDILNAWNGGLQTNEENGTIMANMLGAGRKNEDNTFSGVMMGDMKKGTGNTSAPDETGLYGLYHGDISFALRDNGTATFGVKGRGQIHIDGNDSTIKSSGYADGVGGMLIDLDDGIIDIREPKFINEQNHNTSRFRMTSKNNSILINIDRTQQYLKSDRYDETNLGMYIDLTEGFISMRGEQGSVKIDKMTPYLQIKGPEDGRPLMEVGTDGYYLQSYNYARKGDEESYINDKGEVIYYYEPLDFYISQHKEESYTTALWQINIIDEQSKFILTENFPQIQLRSGEAIYITPLYQIRISENQYYDYITDSDKNISENLNLPNKDLLYDEAFEALGEGPSEADIKNLKKSLVETRISNFEVEKGDKYTTELKGAGLHFNLATGKIEGYDLSIKAFKGNSDDKFITIDSNVDDDEGYPLAIGPRFKVKWDGQCYVKYLSNTYDSYDSDYAIQIGSKFKVTTSGDKLYVNNSDILAKINEALTKAKNAETAVSNVASSISNLSDTVSKMKSIIKTHKHIETGSVTNASTAFNNW